MWFVFQRTLQQARIDWWIPTQESAALQIVAGHCRCRADVCLLLEQDAEDALREAGSTRFCGFWSFRNLEESFRLARRLRPRLHSCAHSRWKRFCCVSVLVCIACVKVKAVVFKVCWLVKSHKAIANFILRGGLARDARACAGVNWCTRGAEKGRAPDCFRRRRNLNNYYIYHVILSTLLWLGVDSPLRLKPTAERTQC